MRYDVIYLSPHLDDAALSCGGQIARHAAAGARVLIVTLMAGDPPAVPLSDYAAAMHARWQLDQRVVAARRGEDRVACGILKADYVHWEIPDCIYRRHPTRPEALYNADAEIFGAIHPADHAPARLKERLAALPPAGRIVAPLAVGNHVDHQLTHLAAAQQYGRDALSYYEDYPYVQTSGALEGVIGAGSEWRAEVIALDPAALAAKYEAIAAYASQIGMFFRDRADLENQVGGYAAAVGGERLWQIETPQA